MLKTGGNVLSMITSRRINRFTPIENDSLETDVVERDRKQSSNAYSVQVRTAHLGNRESRVKFKMEIVLMEVSIIMVGNIIKLSEGGC